MMFDVQQFGRYLARLRKKADLTQAELADRLSLTRQAISRYELGDSLPDLTVLSELADIFGVSLDELIKAGNPTAGEAMILRGVNPTGDVGHAVEDLVNLAPYLKPSVLTSLSSGLSRHGIDISHLVVLADYLNDDAVVALLEKATFDTIDEELLTKLIPVLDEESRYAVFQKILDGKIDWHLLIPLTPYARHMRSQIEAAVLEGALPKDALELPYA